MTELEIDEEAFFQRQGRRRVKLEEGGAELELEDGVEMTRSSE